MANRVQEIGHRVYEVEGLGFRAQDVMILQGLRFVGWGGLTGIDREPRICNSKSAHAHAHTHTKTHKQRHTQTDTATETETETDTETQTHIQTLSHSLNSLTHTMTDTHAHTHAPISEFYPFVSKGPPAVLSQLHI